MPMFGARPLQRTEAPQLVISNLEAPADQYIIDPSLPILGNDPYIPNSDYIVIPRGRLLSVRNTSAVTAAPYANVLNPVLTLANGADGQGAFTGYTIQDLKPMGFSEQQYFRQYQEQIQTFPQMVKNKLVSLPYIQASNGAYGVMRPGDYVTAYYGSATSTTQIANDMGKMCKWQPRRLYWASSIPGSGVVSFGTQAPYPAFVPNVRFAMSSGTVYRGSTPVVSYSNTLSCWVATFGSSVSDVLFDYGQDTDNRGGQVASFEAVGTAGGNLTNPNKFLGWLEWVRDNFGIWAFPPLLVPRPYTNLSNEYHQAGEAGSSTTPALSFQLTSFPIVPKNAVTITITNGQRIDPITGTLTQYVTGGTSYVMPLATSTYYQDFTYGQDYELNPVTGIITFSNNIQTDSATGLFSFTVSYSAEMSFLDGKLYNPGQIGLTDGFYSGVAGTPAHLELMGVVADMHVMVF